MGKRRNFPHFTLAVVCWLVVLAIAIGVALSGCSAGAEETSAVPETETTRFESARTRIGLGDYAAIITDTETGVEYLFFKAGYGGGLTRLVGAEEDTDAAPGEVEVVEVTYDVYAPWSVSDNHASMLAKLAWGEARGCSRMEQAAVMWCVLNRVESEDPIFPDTIEEVITQENQFYYSESFPVRDDLYWLALDVMARWLSEHYMMGESGRVLPEEYLWFSGDGEHNWFRTTYEMNGSNWYWSLPDPYAGGLG